MLTLALTSVPPRFDHLADVTLRLLNQSVPARVVVTFPTHYRRFPGGFDLPQLPKEVEVNRVATDFGPATKLLGCLRDPNADDILYCDDDFAYAPNWAERCLAARQNKAQAVAASTFPVSRLKRIGDPPFDQIAQGFAGVLVRRSMFNDDVFSLPDAACAADDVWFSGYLAARGVPIVEASAARRACVPVDVPGPGLQDVRIAGMTRAEANQACADALTARFGIWPQI